jgi:hypothetical protein
LGEKKKERKRRRKKEKWPGAFVPRAGHALLDVLHGILLVVSAIKGRFKGQSLNFICA